MRRGTFAIGIVALLGAGCGSQKSNVWTATAPSSKGETGLIVQSDQPIQKDLENLMAQAGGSGRILSAEHGLFEIHGVTVAQLKALNPKISVDSNVYFDRVISAAPPSQMKIAVGASGNAEVTHLETSNTVEEKLRSGGIQKCRRDSNTPLAVLTSDRDDDLVNAVVFDKKPFLFKGTQSQPNPTQPSRLRYAIEIQTPSASRLGTLLEVTSQVQLTPDALGAYTITLLVQDERNVCNFATTEFVVSANPAFQGPQAPTPLSHEDLARFTQLSAVEAQEAWKISRGKGVVIAVVDTGVYFNHPDLAANMLINEKEVADNQLDDDKNGYVDDVMGWDFAYSDNNPYDDEGHGTHVAGLAASAVTGIAPEAKILAVKGLNGFGGGDLASMIAAVYYAVDRGANVINASFGSNSPKMAALKKATDYAESKGVVFVAAAGNGDRFGIGMNNDVIPDYPASLPNSNIVAVAALDGDVLTRYSNYGAQTVHVAAPGGSPSKPLLSDAYENELGNRFAGMAGTSMAAPVVSGIVALALSVAPNMPPADLIAAMMVSGRELPDLKEKTRSGRALSAKDLLASLAR